MWNIRELLILNHIVFIYTYIRRLCFSDLVHTVIIWSMCMTNIKRIRVIYHVPGGSGVMVLNATFDDFWVISWRSVFIGEWNQSIRRNPGFIAWCCIEYTLPRAGFELSHRLSYCTLFHYCLGMLCKTGYTNSNNRIHW